MGQRANADIAFGYILFEDIDERPTFTIGGVSHTLHEAQRLLASDSPMEIAKTAKEFGIVIGSSDNTGDQSTYFLCIEKTWARVDWDAIGVLSKDAHCHGLLEHMALAKVAYLLGVDIKQAPNDEGPKVFVVASFG